MPQSTESKWLNFAKRLVLVATICSLAGCASWVSRSPKVILLPEERIFTIPGGQEVKVYLDHKEMMMTFPEDMKLVSPTVLVRQEVRLNNALFEKIRASGKTKIIITILSILAGALGIFFAIKIKTAWPKIKVETK